MQIKETRLPEVLILTPARHGDARGFFSESWNAQTLAAAGIHHHFVQDNHSLSKAPNTLRGLHFQTPPHAQTKLVRCGRGALYDVAVDIRHGSPNFGKWVGVELSFENGHQLLIPAGFMHGFITRAPMTEIIYKCTDTYAPECDAAVRWDDPALNIDWGLKERPRSYRIKTQSASPVRACRAFHMGECRMKLLVTGGAGFIGSAVVRLALQREHAVVNVDALTYAACLDNLNDVADMPDYTFEQADIRDGKALAQIFADHRPDAVLHLAAESHVDRSIDGPGAFIDTNVTGTFTLLQAARSYWEAHGRQTGFRFHHVSTDEVYGSLGAEGHFTEDTAYAPNSPYSASKAASDHLVRAWGETYGLPVLITNCSNNYGHHHFPEKLIPVVILNALAGKPIPVYGTGENVRDWLYVDDHADALLTVLTKALSVGPIISAATPKPVTLIWYGKFARCWTNCSPRTIPTPISSPSSKIALVMMHAMQSTPAASAKNSAGSPR